MKVTIPNPDRPAELEEIETIMHQLEDCKVQGGWKMGPMEHWADHKRELIWSALERLGHLMDDLYPPIVIEVTQATEEEVAA